MKQKVIDLLERRGVTVEAIARVVFESRRHDLPGLTVAEAQASVERVLNKREAQYAILTGLALDMLAEEGRLEEPLGSAIRQDEALFGIDEVLPLAITNLYGPGGLTDFGYLDKVKLGVIGELNQTADGRVNTFLDDLVAGVAAAAGARLVHRRGRPASTGMARSARAGTSGVAGPHGAPGRTVSA